MKKSNSKNSHCSSLFRGVLSLIVIALVGSLSYGQNLDLEPQPDPNKVFMAGASFSNITPQLGEPIVGNWNSPPATQIHDQLYAKTLVLDDGINRLVLVIVDNLGVGREVFDQAKQILEKETGIPVAHLLMAATHTHSGTRAQSHGSHRSDLQGNHPLDDYQGFLVERIVDGVQVAINNLEPSKIAWGSCNVPQHVFNRRWYMKNPVMSPLGLMDKVKMNPGIGNPEIAEPAGPIDPEVSFIAVESLDGRPIAVLGNYSLHYVGGVPKGHISADYFGVFGDKLQTLLGVEKQQPRFVGIMSNGTSGDINNINFAGPREKRAAYEKMQLVANDVANEVYLTYQTLEFQDWVPLRGVQSELTLKVRQASSQVLENMERVRARSESDDPIFHRHEKTYASRIERLENEWPDEIDIILQVFRIGDLGIATIPFETFAETGLEIKNRSPFEKVFTIELANGSYGYLPTPEQHELGGYETWLGTNNVEIDASTKIVSKLMSLMDLALTPASKNITAAQNGLIHEVLEEGTGNIAAPGDEVVVHEQMGYLDGTILYSTKPGGPVRFLLGGGQAIEGVDLGVQGMKEGETRKLIVPPALSKRSAYPNFLSPDSTLVYEIELLNIIPPEDFPPLSARGKIVQQVGFNTITIESERPSVRGRKIYGGLVPFDTLWKTGAGSGVKMKFSEPVSIDENAIEAGTYALMTIPGKDSWTVILTKDTTFYINRKEYEPEKEVARFEVKPENTARFYESFTIDVDVIPHNADIYLSWENTQINFTLKTGTDEKIESFIKENLLSAKSQNPGLYATAADYYYFGNKELETALTLIDLAIKKGPEPWHYRLKMDILERMNRNEEALEVANSAIRFVNERADELGWDAETKQQSISQYNKRIEGLKESMRK